MLLYNYIKLYYSFSMEKYIQPPHFYFYFNIETSCDPLLNTEKANLSVQ